jgi:hypothetical protein
MKLSVLTLFICSLAACSKTGSISNECANVTFYSDKYTLDSVFVRSDLMMEERPVCGIDLQRCKDANKAAPFKPCALNMMEIHRYKIGMDNSKPKLFK